MNRDQAAALGRAKLLTTAFEIALDLVSHLFRVRFSTAC
jgi:hypothetical protein